MHVPCRENVYEESDECDEADVDRTQTIDAKREVGTKSAHMDPGPDVIEDWLIRRERSFVRGTDAEGDHERDDRRDRDRPACDEPAKRLVLQPPTDQPINDRTREGGKNDYAD